MAFFKNVLTFCLIASMFYLASCGSDDPEPIEALIGTWESTKVVTSGCTDPNDINGTLTCTGGFCLQITIGTDGKYTVTDNLEAPPSVETGTITATSNTLKLCQDGDNTCDDTPNTYSLTGDTLIITFTDEDSPGCQFAATFIKQ